MCQSGDRTHRPRSRDDLALQRVVDGRGRTGLAEMFVGGGEQIRLWLGQCSPVQAEAHIARAKAGGTNLLCEAREGLQRLWATVNDEASGRYDLPSDFAPQLFSDLDADMTATAAVARGKAQSGEGEDATARAEGAVPPADASPDAPDPAGAPPNRHGARS